MNKQNKVVAIAGLLSVFSSVAFAGTLASERDLEKKIQESIAQKDAADTIKYNRVAALAGGKRDQLSAKNTEVTNAYKKWRELKSAAEASQTDTAKLKAVEAGAKYAQANKEFIDMQKGILVKMSDDVTVAEAINALNATAPAAAGRQQSKQANLTDAERELQLPFCICRRETWKQTVRMQSTGMAFALFDNDVTEDIWLDNQDRPHTALDDQTPDEFYFKNLPSLPKAAQH